jgi:haloalkane dehalogenase
MTVDFVRTPEERFADLPEFPYGPKYAEVDGLRMAYVEEGSGEAGTILLLHGEPTWGYLYRRMIPPLVEAGHRIIAPDLIGFGRSDKPTDRASYTYANHVAWLTEFVGGLDRPADGFHVFVQDWGGLLGLRMIAEQPDWFDRVVIGNTALPTGEPMGDGFMMWQQISQAMDPMDCGALLGRACVARELSDAEMDAYRAPFPDESLPRRCPPVPAAGARRHPTIPPCRRTRPPGPCGSSGTPRCSRCGRLATSCSVTSRARSSIASRVPPASHTRPSNRVATSCRTTGARTSQQRSSSGCHARSGSGPPGSDPGSGSAFDGDGTHGVSVLDRFEW